MVVLYKMNDTGLSAHSKAQLLRNNAPVCGNALISRWFGPACFVRRIFTLFRGEIGIGGVLKLGGAVRCLYVRLLIGWDSMNWRSRIG